MSAPLVIGSTWDGHPLPAEHRAAVQLVPDGAGLSLRLVAPRAGDPPPGAPPGPTPRLWEHEVVELFLVGDDGTYLEVELGPAGHHLVLRLRGVRDVIDQGLPLHVDVADLPGDLWAARAHLPAGWLPPRPWRANAYRIHGPAHDRRYHAATALPGPTPDFHQPDRFAPLADPTDDPATPWWASCARARAELDR